MPTQILMPALSPTMTEGNIAKWLKAEGDTVEAGDVIAEIETDKATMEVEAVDEGILGKILVPAGTQNVPVNDVIAVLLEEGERVEDLSIGGPEDSKKEKEPEPSESSNPQVLESSNETTVRESIRDAIAEEMRRDGDVFLMGEEVAEYQGAYKCSQGLLEEFGPERIIDTPITEYGFTGLALGAAMNGLKPVVEFMTWNFAMQAIDHIVTSGKTLYMGGGQIACPMVFRGPNGAASRVAAQHSQCYASWYAHVPGLKVVAPWSGEDAKGLLKAAIRDPGPVIVLENELLYGEAFEVPVSDDFIVPIGQAKIEREGTDVTIVAFSIMVGKALKAAEELAGQGIEAEVINLRTIRPLDTDTILESLRKTNRIVVAEEGWAFSGIGAEIAALAGEQAFDYLDAPVARVCGADVPMPYAANLEKLALPQAEDIVAAARRVCYLED